MKDPLDVARDAAVDEMNDAANERATALTPKPCPYCEGIGVYYMAGEIWTCIDCCGTGQGA